MRASDGCGWSRPGTLPTGNDFLPDTDAQILLEMIAACPSGKARDILRACYERKINASIRRIRDLLMRPYSTVREWLWRMHERGLDNISDRKPPGARGILGPEGDRDCQGDTAPTTDRTRIRAGGMASAHDRRGHHKKAEKTLQATYPAEATAQNGILVRKAQNRPAQVRLQNGAGGVYAAVRTAGQ